MCCCLLNAVDEKPWDSGSIFPAWADVKPARVLAHRYDKAGGPEENGLALVQAIAGLKPGEQLLIEGGVYSVNKFWDINLRGQLKRPVWIAAGPRQKVVITRADRKNNLVNFGKTDDGVAYLCVRGIEFRGGSSIISIHKASHLWIDQCHIHDGDNVGIAANTVNADHLYITRNRIHDPGTKSATAEGMYLGSNNAKSVIHSSVIAFNEVSDCHGTQGDGIELKQGSYNNWLVGNRVYNCNYPCILVYGSDGKGVNLVENNICYNSGDHAMQVQGDAIVRNNVLINSKGATFNSSNHQGEVNVLQVYNNTFINTANAAELRHWNKKEKMVFADNACYSISGQSIKVVGGHEAAYVEGNVVFGQVSGFSGPVKVSRFGLGDFVGVSADGLKRDVRPAKDSMLMGSAGGGVDNPGDFYRLPRPQGSACVGAALPRNQGVRLIQSKLKSPKIKVAEHETADWEREEPGVHWECERYRVHKEKVWLLLPATEQ